MKNSIFITVEDRSHSLRPGMVAGFLIDSPSIRFTLPPFHYTYFLFFYWKQTEFSYLL